VLLELGPLGGGRLAVLLAGPLRAAPGDERAVVAQHVVVVGGRVRLRGVQVLVAEDLGGDVDRRPPQTASVAKIRRKWCGVLAQRPPVGAAQPGVVDRQVQQTPDSGDAHHPQLGSVAALEQVRQRRPVHPLVLVVAGHERRRPAGSSPSVRAAAVRSWRGRCGRGCPVGSAERWLRRLLNPWSTRATTWWGESALRRRLLRQQTRYLHGGRQQPSVDPPIVANARWRRLAGSFDTRTGSRMARRAPWYGRRVPPRWAGSSRLVAGRRLPGCCRRGAGFHLRGRGRGRMSCQDGCGCGMSCRCWTATPTRDVDTRRLGGPSTVDCPARGAGRRAGASRPRAAWPPLRCGAGYRGGLGLAVDLPAQLRAGPLDRPGGCPPPAPPGRLRPDRRRPDPRSHQARPDPRR
jgi:hypothetical protein